MVDIIGRLSLGTMMMASVVVVVAAATAAKVWFVASTFGEQQQQQQQHAPMSPWLLPSPSSFPARSNEHGTTRRDAVRIIVP